MQKIDAIPLGIPGELLVETNSGRCHLVVRVGSGVKHNRRIAVHNYDHGMTVYAGGFPVASRLDPLTAKAVCLKLLED